MPGKKASSAGNQQERLTYWDQRILGGTLVGGGLLLGLLIYDSFIRNWAEKFSNSKEIEFITAALIGLLIAIPSYHLIMKILFRKRSKK